MTIPSNQSGCFSFDASAWKATFPLFSSLSDPQAEFYFNCACDYLNNTPASPVRNLAQRERLLWLLTAHLEQLGLTADQDAENAPNGLVGRISSASRGSVSLSTDGSGIPRNGWWFAQTPYGASFWQATLPLRQMHLLPGRPHFARIFP
ncbi:DUF4054 domain-containing protein [Acetobacteraceae bacterium]|nr:DUF4054 domain-containing protein [Acetobacteraceae bacterium]